MTERCLFCGEIRDTGGSGETVIGVHLKDCPSAPADKSVYVYDAKTRRFVFDSHLTAQARQDGDTRDRQWK
jgi:hypothetical protein